ncbi:PWI domain containing protein [Brugia malayi]|uniref:BMA-RSR-1, isoform e n=1 Tax=Brugia malayi TaxID=6279 RepID=A0A0K0JBC4_BRUMA|nr:PWI domain containing protein [Brugia malayi]CDQ02720.1 BMA-RSR-1, isoform e [Brugia malayi]VIO96715.1 PWI domain containing protein [Brugia malayi]
MADAGFYRGTSSEQDSRFTDKERKLLKQMRFEEALDEKICMDRVNLDVLKPWITAKLNDILGIEDDVVIEYVFSQLEEKSLNPKVMQINLTGFLNARRAREFMGELWSMLIEAQSSDDGIPTSLVEKKMKEIQEKAKNTTVSSSNGAAAEVAGSDWKNRYDSLTGGRYGNRESRSITESERGRKDDDRHRTHRDNNRDRENDKSGESGRVKEDGIERKRGEEKQFKDEKLRSHSRSPTRRHFHDERTERKKERYRSPNRSPPRRKFTERKEETRRRSRSNERRRRKRSISVDLVDEKQSSSRKKKKKHSKKRASDSDSERAKRRKKHKKEKKRKKHNSSDSD